jgi:cell wall-associated NlpC family hydrolase
MLQHRTFSQGPWVHEIIRHANTSPTREVCGVILRDGELIELANVAESDHEFELPEEFEACRDRAICIYHSHVGIETAAHLSPADILNAKEQGIAYLTYHAQFHQWDYYDPTALHPFPLEMTGAIAPTEPEYYLLWRFDYGRSDCYSLCRSWYAGMLGIDLGDYQRADLGDVTPIQFMDDRFIEQGFVKLGPNDQMQAHDLICFDIAGGTYNHIGICRSAEYNQLLHNLGEGRYSEVTAYNQSWRDRTRSVFRHRLLLEASDV